MRKKIKETKKAIAVLDEIQKTIQSENLDRHYLLTKNYLNEKGKQQVSEETNSTNKEQEIAPAHLVISGTQGLADFLGCSKTMAFSIIKEGKLLQEGIQYKVGNCWKFNRKKLEYYIKDNPTIFSKTRSKA